MQTTFCDPKKSKRPVPLFKPLDIELTCPKCLICLQARATQASAKASFGTWFQVFCRCTGCQEVYEIHGNKGFPWYSSKITCGDIIDRLKKDTYIT